MISHMLPAPKVECSGNATIITFTGNRSRGHDNMIAADLQGLTDDLGRTHLLLDFTQIEYLRSVELGTLIGLHNRVAASGGQLTLFNLSAMVFGVFEATRLQTLLDICREGAKVIKTRELSGKK